MKYTGEFRAPSFLSTPISVKCFSHLSAAFCRSPKCISIARRLMQVLVARYAFIFSNIISSVCSFDLVENFARSKRVFIFTSCSIEASGRNFMLRTLIWSARTLSADLPSGMSKSTDSESSLWMEYRNGDHVTSRESCTHAVPTRWPPHRLLSVSRRIVYDFQVVGQTWAHPQRCVQSVAPCQFLVSSLLIVFRILCS